MREIVRSGVRIIFNSMRHIALDDLDLPGLVHKHGAGVVDVLDPAG